VVLDFLAITDVERLVPVTEDVDTGSDVSEWELGERREREEERGAEAEALGAGEELLEYGSIKGEDSELIDYSIMRAQDLSIYRKAVRTKDGRLPPEPVLGDSVMSGRHLQSVISGRPLFRHFPYDGRCKGTQERRRKRNPRMPL